MITMTSGPKDSRPRLKVREMTYGDIPGVMEIERVSFRSPWSEGMFLKELRSPISYSFVAVGKRAVSEDVLGYVNFWVVAGEIHLNNIAVDGAFKRTGVASALITRMFETGRRAGAARATLEVREANTAALALYRKFGFAVAGKRPRYYSDTGEDALIMWAELKTEHGN